MIRHAVMASLLGFLLVTPALAGDLADDIAERNSAIAQLHADQAKLVNDIKNHASPSVIAQDRANVKSDQQNALAILVDIRQDRHEVSPH